MSSFHKYFNNHYSDESFKSANNNNGTPVSYIVSYLMSGPFPPPFVVRIVARLIDDGNSHLFLYSNHFIGHVLSVANLVKTTDFILWLSLIREPSVDINIIEAIKTVLQICPRNGITNLLITSFLSLMPHHRTSNNYNHSTPHSY